MQVGPLLRPLLRFGHRGLSALERRGLSAQQRQLVHARILQDASRHFGTTSPSSGEEGVIRSPYRDVHIPDNINLGHYMMESFSKFTDKPALVDGLTGRTLTYGQLQALVRRTASALVRAGLGKGEVVTIFSPNVPEFAVVYLAIVAMGGVVSCLNPLYTPGELQHALDHSKSKMCVTIPQLVPVVKAATKMNTNFQGIVVFGEAEGCRPLADLFADDGTLYPDSPTDNPRKEAAALPFSSGTTGLPKGVQLSHYNIIANIEQTACTAEMVEYDPDRDSILGLLPFFHIFGQVIVMLSGLRNGVKVVTMPKFEPEPFLQIMQGYRVTTLHVAPPLILFVAKHPLVDMYDLRHMHTMVAGAASAPESVVAAMMDRLKIPDFAFRQGFGMTEASPVTHVNPAKGFKLGTCGVAVHNTEFKVVDVETNKSLGEGEKGELWVRGPQVMLGYLNNDEATAETLDQDGWLHTGDLAHFDSDRHIVISDRLKELIKHKGFQVAPAEIENLLLTHPSVGDVAVIGVPDIRAGELPRAFVVLKPGTKATEEELQNFVKGKVAAYKELQGGVEFRSEIPKNLTGKILRRQLRDEHLAQKE